MRLLYAVGAVSAFAALSAAVALNVYALLIYAAILEHAK